MNIVIVTDAWHPQVNGVVRTLEKVIERLRQWGHRVDVFSPDQFRSLPCPSYPEIRLGLTRSGSIGRKIAKLRPDAVHLSTEGPLCWSARRWCLKNNVPYTSAYHTQFPQYAAKRTGLPERVFWPLIRRFHGPSHAIMVSTNSIGDALRSNRLDHIVRWSRGVDQAQFRPDATPPTEFANLPRPIQLYVGRVAVEKNIEAFLKTKERGSKVIVGDGPALDALRVRYPRAHFLGRKSGRDLAACYAHADVFVFPSRSDTFGLVIIEALACGTPVAAFPVSGPIDILSDGTGAMDEDLDIAIDRALGLHPADCIALAKSYSWEASARQFLDALVPIETVIRPTMDMPFVTRRELPA
ncbi:MAG: glycosyltransferase family 1 protein [Parasphingorhabdus sp.]|nr:glycosyltransferase family 1 protein [Parasphingorhabdus sp.]